MFRVIRVFFVFRMFCRFRRFRMRWLGAMVGFGRYPGRASRGKAGRSP